MERNQIDTPKYYTTSYAIVHDTVEDYDKYDLIRYYAKILIFCQIFETRIELHFYKKIDFLKLLLIYKIFRFHFFFVFFFW